MNYKTNYDSKSRTREYRVGDWVLIRFPQEESGANQKLSRPWYGPFRVIESDATDITAVRVYGPQDSLIQVHQSRVTCCPPGFPAGYWWYGNHRHGPGRPPKWTDRYLQSWERNSDSEPIVPTARNENVEPEGSLPEEEEGDQEQPAVRDEDTVRTDRQLLIVTGVM